MSTLREDLIALRDLKVQATMANAQAKDLGREKQELENHVLTRMQTDEDEIIEAMRTGSSMFTYVAKSKAVVNDRSAFIAWCLDPANDAEDLIQYEPRQKECNALVNQLLDDGADEWPPGLTFRNADYVSVTGS